MSNHSRHQLEPKFDESLLEAAVKEWCPDADAKVINFLSGGYSGAVVLLIDIERKQKNSELPSGEVKIGTYVLKLDTNRPREGSAADEAQRHSTASEWSPEFANEHMPPLRRHFHAQDRVALLYEIAGKSFTRLVRAELIPLGPLENRLRKLSEKLLRELNKDSEISREQTVEQLMREWLSWRLEPSQAPELFALTKAVAGNQRSFVQRLHILANPIALAAPDFAGKAVKVIFRGMLHGDLHRENVFWDRPDRKSVV